MGLSPFRVIGLPAGQERLGLALLPAPPVPGATGSCAGVFWMLSAMPAQVWIRLVRQNASLVWAGIVIRAAPCFLTFFFVVVLSVRRPAWTPAGRNRGGDVLCLGDVPAGQGRGCHNGPCHDKRADHRGGSVVRELEFVELIRGSLRGLCDKRIV